MSTNPQDQFTALAQQSQEAFLKAVESWTRILQQSVGQMPAAASPANPDQVIDQVFDFATKMLEMQRDFAKNVVKTSSDAAQAATQQAKSTTKSR